MAAGAARQVYISPALQICNPSPEHVCLLIQPNSACTFSAGVLLLVGPYVHTCMDSYVPLTLSYMFCAFVLLFLSLHAWSNTTHTHLHACLELVFFSLDAWYDTTHHTCPLACMFAAYFFFLYVRACSFFSVHICWHLQSLLSSFLFSFDSRLLFTTMTSCC